MFHMGSFYTLATLEKISTLKFLFYFLWLGGSNGVGFNTQTLNVCISIHIDHNNWPNANDNICVYHTIEWLGYT